MRGFLWKYELVSGSGTGNFVGRPEHVLRERTPIVNRVLTQVAMIAAPCVIGWTGLAADRGSAKPS
jgi:hypothetical protein